MGEYNNTYMRISELKSTIEDDKAYLEIIRATRKLIENTLDAIDNKIEMLENMGEDTSYAYTYVKEIWYKGNCYSSIDEYKKLSEFLDQEENDYSQELEDSKQSIGECRGYLSELNDIDGGY